VPKLKTLKGAAKRFKVTGTGKLRRYRAGKSHLLTGKSRQRKRPLRRPGLVSEADAARIKRLLPNHW
jgi:large subunit ribosomal protein L35